MKTLFKSVCLMFVPILGLISCSVDRHADDWQMSQPTVEAPGEPALTLNAASRRTLNGESHLTFSGSSWEKLKAKSTCRFGDQVASNEALIPYRETLSLRELWPLDFVRKLSTVELMQSECDFEFVAENEKHSTHSFSLDHIKLAKFADQSTTAKFLALDASGESNKSQPVTAMASDYRDDAELRLICGKIVGALSNRAVVRAPDAVKSLEMQVALRGRQLCHFVAVQRELDGRNSFQLTDDISLKFPSVALLLAFSQPVSTPIAINSAYTPALFRATLQNSSNASTFIRATDPRGASIRLVGKGKRSPSDNTQQLFEAIETVTTSIAVGANGSNEIAKRTDGSKVYEVKPGEVLTIELNFSAASYLFGRCGLPIDSSTSTQLLGFKYGLDSQFEILQSDVADGSDESTIFSIPAGSNGNLPNSIVLDAFQNQFGRTFDSAGFIPQVNTTCPNL